MIDDLIKFKNEVVIITEKLILKSLTNNDITNDYISWMNDLIITRYTEQRFKTHNFLSIKNFLLEMNASPSNLLFGIFFENKHVGNIKLGSINFVHCTANISYLIGSKKYWGKGIATNSIKKISDMGFKKLNLKKITAGIYANNLASKRVLEKNDFICEGIRKKQYSFDKERIDGLIYGKYYSIKTLSSPN